MIKDSDLIFWWNLPICIFFGIVFAPIGLLLLLIVLIPRIFAGGDLSEINYWAIFTPGFVFGLYLSLATIGSLIVLFKKLFNIR